MKLKDLTKNNIPQLAKWFDNRIKQIMEHNNYHDGMRTATECASHDQWSPCDLIAREYLNNGGGSAKGFLGITKGECVKCYNYMVENRDLIVSLDLISQKG
jgi:hypothetical protein